MKQKIILLFCWLALSCIAHAQSKLILKDSLLYTNIRFSSSHADSTLSLLDTGCSLCVIDSTFAVDALNLKINQQNKVLVNSNDNRLSTCIIDTIVFCDRIYKEVPCMVVDLKGIYQEYAPKFIIGASILSDRPLKFDFTSGTLYPIKYDKSIKNGLKLSWKDSKQYSDIPIGYIIFDTEINGKEVRLAFDTGSKTNKLPSNFQLPSPILVQRESANLNNKLKTRTVKYYKDITIRLGKSQYTLNFFEGNKSFGLLNLDFLKGHSFVLDYRERYLLILPF